MLRANSPLTALASMQRPLLVAQGARDIRVKKEQADELVHLLEANQRAVTYLVFPDDGHGFASTESAIAFRAVAEMFLAQHLGGRCEDLAADVASSRVEVPVGAQHIAGLAAALAGQTNAAPKVGAPLD